MKKNLRFITIPALFAAISILLSYFEIPILPAFPFLKLDFAEVPIILCAMLTGPLSALGAEAVRSLIALLLTGTASAGVGTAFNFVMGVIFVLLYCLNTRFLSHKAKAWLALLSASVLTIVIACFLNFVAVVPLYKAIGMVPQSFDTLAYVAAGALPLNLIKWPVNAAIAGALYQNSSLFFKKAS